MAISTQCIKRLQKELKGVKDEGLDACPDSRDILTWYFCFEGPSGTAYAGGEYMGKLRFPPNYPFAPPSIFMLTPNGRFQTDTRLCLSMSDFHPESWSPAWNVATIVRGVLSFMAEETQTYGSIQTDATTREKFAQHSRLANLKMSSFLASFPQRVAATRMQIEKQQQEEQQREDAARVSSPSSSSAQATARAASAGAKLRTASGTDAAAAAAVAEVEEANAVVAAGWVPQRNFLVQGRQWVADGFGLVVGGGARRALLALMASNNNTTTSGAAAAGAAVLLGELPPQAAGQAAGLNNAGVAGTAAVASTATADGQLAVVPDRDRQQIGRRRRQLLWVLVSLIAAVVAVAGRF